MKTTADAKIFLGSMGFPCFYGDTLSYVQIANIFKNKIDAVRRRYVAEKEYGFTKYLPESSAYKYLEKRGVL